jgi:Na+-driven multidrug efflux pump
LEEEVRKSAYQYFIIFGGIGAPFTAFNMFQTGLLRTYGYTKETFIVTIVSNLVNVAGNAVAIYGFAGIPATGTAGVAAASVLSMIAGNIMMTIFIRRRSDIQFRIFKSPKVPATVNKKILSIGVPTAGESLSYNVAQIVIMAMISSLGTFAMNSQVYTTTIVRFVFSIAVAMGSAVQIKVGYYVGEGKKDTAYKQLRYVHDAIVDNAVYDCAKATVEGTLTAGVKTYDITNGGVDIAPTTTLLPAEVLSAVEEVKAKLLDGSIVVPSNQAEFEAAYGDIYVLD